MYYMIRSVDYKYVFKKVIGNSQQSEDEISHYFKCEEKEIITGQLVCLNIL